MEEMTKVAVDAMGGDYAPSEAIKGAVAAVKEKENVEVFLVGKQEILERELASCTYPKERIHNSVEMILPRCQTVDTGITADFGKCHIHGCRYVRFQLQNLQYLDKQRLPSVGCFQIFLNSNQVFRLLFNHLLEPGTVLLQFHTDSLGFGISRFHF